MRTPARFLFLALVATTGCYSIGNPDQTPTGPDSPGPAPSASVSGRVLSKELGVMAGVTVMASPGDLTTTTGADGQWHMDEVTQGHVSFVLGHLPAGCVAPVPQEFTIHDDVPIRVRMLVDCSGTGK